MRRAAAVAAAGAALGLGLVAGCTASGQDPAADASSAWMRLDMPARIDPGPGFVDVYTGCEPGTTVRVFISAGEGNGGGVAVVNDPVGCTPRALREPPSNGGQMPPSDPAPTPPEER